MVKSIKPKGLGPYIGIVEIGRGRKCLWHLISTDCNLIKSGYSKIGSTDAMRNCEAAARRMAKKEYPAFYSYKSPKSTSVTGNQSALFGEGQ